MDDQQLSKEEQLIAFFVSQCNGRLGRTQIVKMLYLSDYESRKYLGRPLTDLNYIWYNHGPFDKQIYSGIERLKGHSIIREEKIPLASGRTSYRYHTSDQPITYDFSGLELEILGHVVRTYSELELPALLDDVYETEPMQKAQATESRNGKLDFSMVDRMKAKEFGLSTEVLFKRIQRVRAGTYMTHADVMSSLRRPAVSAAR